VRAAEFGGHLEIRTEEAGVTIALDLPSILPVAVPGGEWRPLRGRW
jgi:hypothetical protein